MALVNNATTAIGFSQMSMIIEEITPDVNGTPYAYGTDSMQRPVRVNANRLPAKCPAPQVGEKWLISKAVSGVWSLVGIVNPPPPPVISGAISDGTALTNLLYQLDQVGLIQNNTIPEARDVSEYLPAADVLST